MAVSIHFEHAGVAIVAVMGALRLHDFDFLSVCIFSQILIMIPFNQIKFILVRALQARLESQLLGLFIQSKVVRIILILLILFISFILLIALDTMMILRITHLTFFALFFRETQLCFTLSEQISNLSIVIIFNNIFEHIDLLFIEVIGFVLNKCIKVDDARV